MEWARLLLLVVAANVDGMASHIAVEICRGGIVETPAACHNEFD